MRKKSELEQRRNRNIAQREAQREQNNASYCEHIRDMKTQENLRSKERSSLVANAKERGREQRMEERRVKADADNVAATLNTRREVAIGDRERKRDLEVAAKVRAQKEEEQQQKLENEAKKLQKRLENQELAVKRQEEEAQKRKHNAVLNERREEQVKAKDEERNRREKERMKAAGGAGTSTTAAAAPEAAVTA